MQTTAPHIAPHVAAPAARCATSEMPRIRKHARPCPAMQPRPRHVIQTAGAVPDGHVHPEGSLRRGRMSKAGDVGCEPPAGMTTPTGSFRVSHPGHHSPTRPANAPHSTATPPLFRRAPHPAQSGSKPHRSLRLGAASPRRPHTHAHEPRSNILRSVLSPIPPPSRGFTSPNTPPCNSRASNMRARRHLRTSHE